MKTLTTLALVLSLTACGGSVDPKSSERSEDFGKVVDTVDWKSTSPSDLNQPKPDCGPYFATDLEKICSFEGSYPASRGYSHVWWACTYDQLGSNGRSCSPMTVDGTLTHETEFFWCCAEAQ